MNYASKLFNPDITLTIFVIVTYITCLFGVLLYAVGKYENKRYKRNTPSKLKLVK